MTRFIAWEELTNRILGSIPHSDRVLLGREADAPGIDRLLKQELPEGEIWLYHSMISCNGEALSLQQLLMDERYAQGYMNIPIGTIEKCGYLNERLPEKRIYELLLRMAEHHPVIGMKLDKEEMPQKKADTDVCSSWGNYQADAYVTGKYSRCLKEAGYFEPVVETLLEQAQVSGECEKYLEYLEDMIGHGKQYRRLEDGTAPVLIYYGVTYCYNILNIMLAQLEKSLKKLGVCVISYDEQVEDVAGLSRYTGRRFRAIIGMQSYLMSIYMKESGRFLHDEMTGPKFNILLDHPVWLKGQLTSVPKDYYVLTHDDNYRSFIKTYYPEVKDSYLFPPAGIRTEGEAVREDRKYGISFIGTYGNYRKLCEVIRQSNREMRFLANRFLLIMRKDTGLTAENAFLKALEYYGVKLSDEQFLELFYEMRPVIQCVMYYYRERVVCTLLEAGIRVDIWGESWRDFRFADHSALVIHRDVNCQEGLEVLKNSKISLNVMAWHKGGFTERLANSMLAGAAVLTDWTTYNGKGFSNGRQCVMFSLQRLERLPEIARKLLEDEKWRKEIAGQGYRYAEAYHTWDCRAGELLTILENMERMP